MGRKQRRQTAWQQGLTNEHFVFTTESGVPPPTVISRDIWTATTSPERATVVRMVGEVQIMPDSTGTNFEKDAEL